MRSQAKILQRGPSLWKAQHLLHPKQVLIYYSLALHTLSWVKVLARREDMPADLEAKRSENSTCASGHIRASVDVLPTMCKPSQKWGVKG